MLLRTPRTVERVVNAVEHDDIKAVEPLMKLVAQLDRYHGLAGPAPLAPPARPLGLPPATPAPLALTHAAPPLAIESQGSEFSLEGSGSTRELKG